MSDEGPSALVIEDDPSVRRFLRASLSAQGFRLHEAVTGREGLAAAASHNPEVVLLDLGLPDGDGIEVTRKLREWSRVPIIVISARGREDDKVTALDAGADDYLTKPFGVNELLARIRVALRHARALRSETPAEVVEVSGLRVDMAMRDVSVDGKTVHLTPIEYRLLKLLAENVGKVMTHKQILKEVWGPGHNAQTHSLRVHMAELRKKLERNPAKPRWIINEPGVGYRLRLEEPASGET
jgi:two-component system KDP operon response regulator KdpE